MLAILANRASIQECLSGVRCLPVVPFINSRLLISVLTAHAAAPAGGGVGPSAILGATPSSALSGWDDRLDAAPPPATQPATPHLPFYKRRWFIISQIILIPLAIALIFILLFPVVHAIVALVVKRTNLDIQAAVITQPVNNS
jgi:hypothetical protein